MIKIKLKVLSNELRMTNINKLLNKRIFQNNKLLNNKFSQRIIAFFDDYLNMLTFFIFSMRSVVINRDKGKGIIIESIIKQILFTGVKSLVVMSIISLLIGVVVIFIANSYGLSEDITSSILTSTIIEYVGPIIIMMMLIGRSGTAIAAELGNMSISHEIEALEIMGIDPLHFIVAPRIIGMTISIFCLGIYFSLVGILGGAVVMVNVIATFSLNKFYRTFFSNIEISLFVENLLKIICFGIIISTVSCYQGLKVQHSTTEIPRTTTQAVARSTIICFIFYAYLTVTFSI